MCRSECMRAIKKLERLTKMSHDPADMLINIADSCKNVNMDDESWANFYCYITCPNRDEWEYKPKNEIKTMGDLTEEEFAMIEADLARKTNGDNMVHTVFENGIETFVDCKYINNHGEQVARICEELPQETSGSELETVFESSLRGIQEDEKFCGET